jgi:predicted MFS family arabinose efflux permease
MIDRRAHVRRETRSSMWHSMAEGYRYAARDPTTRIVVIFTAVPFLLLTPTWSTLLPVFARDVFGSGPQALGWMLTTVGLGGLTGGLLSAGLSRLDRVGWVQITSLILFCVSLLGISRAPTMWIALPFIFAAGVSEIVNSTAGQTVLQVSTPGPLRGRIMSLLQLNSALISVGSVIAGAGADWIGPRGITALNGVIGLAVGALIVFASARLRNMRLSHYTGRVSADAVPAADSGS